MNLIYKIASLKYFILIVFCLILQSRESHAGSWSKDKVIWNGLRHDETIYYQGGYSSGKYNCELVKANTIWKDGIKQSTPYTTDGYPNWLTGGWSPGRNYYQASNVLEYPDSSPIPANAKTNMAVYTTIKWHRDNPDDNPPPYVYVMEKVGITAHRRTSSNFLNVQARIGNDDVVCVLHDSDFVYDQYAGTATLSKTVIKRLKVTGDFMAIPTVAIGGSVNITSGYEVDNTSGAGNLIFDYNAGPVNIEVLARLKANHTIDTFEDYSSSATIEAGHLVNSDHLHEADVALRFSMDNQGVADAHVLDIPELEVINPNGEEKNSEFQEDAFETTNGNGQIYFGNFLSRDLLPSELLNNHTLLRLKDTPSTNASISEAWAVVDWKTSDVDRSATNWQPNPLTGPQTFWDSLDEWPESAFTDGGYTKIAYAKLTSIAGKPTEPTPLRQHACKFLVDYLQVQVTDPDTDRKITKIFVSDPSLADQYADQYAGNNDYQVIYRDDITPLVALYITPPSPGVTDDQGIVKGEFSVKTGDSFQVLSYNFALEDQGVYHTEKTP